jgi:hypothetical protein
MDEKMKLNIKGKRFFVTVWFFDCEGDMVKEEFSDHKEALEYAKNHALEIFKTETGYKPL